MTGAGSSVVVSRTIARPPEVVWAYLADMEGHSRWMTDVVGMDFEGQSRRGPGTRLIVKTRVGPFRTDDILEVVEWHEGSFITVAHRGAVKGEGRLSIEPVQSGSLVTWEESLRFPWWLGGPLGGLVATPILRRVWRRNLAALDELVIS